MSSDNDQFRRTEIVRAITSKQSVNTGAQGDWLYLPVISMISNSISYDSNDDKESTLHLEYITDNCFRSNFVSEKSKENQACFSTSSATFIVSSSPSLEKTILQDTYNTSQRIHSETNVKSLLPRRILHHHRPSLWFRQHWISIAIISGILVVFIFIITISVFIR